MKTILITGASGGIGLDFAKILGTHKNHQLILVARNENKLKEIQAELSLSAGGVRIYAADLSDLVQVEALVEKLSRDKVSVDLLINNAGVGMNGAFAAMDARAQVAMVQLNVTALTYLTRLLLPSMIAQKSGEILNVASTAAFQPGPYMAVYYATKAYVVSFSEAIAIELEGTGVTVTTLCPGPTATDFFTRADFGQTALLKSFGTMTSLDVARYGVKSMSAKKGVAIPGWKNRVLATIVGFTPRRISARIAKKLQEKS